MKLLYIFGIFLMGVCITLASVFAFAVSSQYYDGNPLYLLPGQSQTTKFILQAGAKNVSLIAKISEGKDIITITDPQTIYTISAGEKTDVHFIVTAPLDAKHGERFPVSIEFNTISTTSGEGPITIGSSIGKGFDLIIGDAADFKKSSQEKNNHVWIYIGIALVVLICIVFILGKKILIQLITIELKIKKIIKNSSKKF